MRIDDLRAVLPRHQALFLTSDAGPVSNASGRANQQDFGLATFVGEEIPVVGSRTSFVRDAFVGGDLNLLPDSQAVCDPR